MLQPRRHCLEFHPFEATCGESLRQPRRMLGKLAYALQPGSFGESERVQPGRALYEAGTAQVVSRTAPDNNACGLSLAQGDKPAFSVPTPEPPRSHVP